MPRNPPYTPPPDKTEQPIQSPSDRKLANQRVVKLGDAIAIVVRGNEILLDELVQTINEQISSNLGLNLEGVTKLILKLASGVSIPGKGTAQKALMNQAVELIFSVASNEALRRNLNALANTQVEQLNSRKLRQGDS